MADDSVDLRFADVSEHLRNTHKLLSELTTKVHTGFTVVSNIKEQVDRLEKVVLIGNSNPSLTTRIKLIETKLDSVSETLTKSGEKLFKDAQKKRKNTKEDTKQR